MKATLMVDGSSRMQAKMMTSAPDPTALDAMLRSECPTIWLLMVLTAENAVLQERRHLYGHFWLVRLTRQQPAVGKT